MGGHRCRICAGEGQEVFRKRGYVIAQCGACESRFVPSPLPAPVDYEADYFDAESGTGYASYVLDRDLILENFGRRVQWFAKLATGPRLLDVGAAYGFLVAAARASGFDAIGVEPAEACARWAADELGVAITTGRIEEAQLEPESFDVVTLFDVIEHLEDPSAALTRVHQLLKPGGMVVIETGDLSAALSRFCGRRWYYYDPPQHLSYFSWESLAEMLERVGFERPAETVQLGRAVSLRNVTHQLGRALGDGPLGQVSRAVSQSALGAWTFHVPDRGNAFAVAAYRPDGVSHPGAEAGVGH